MRNRNPGEGRRAALELSAAAFPVFQHCVGAGWVSALAGGGAAGLVLTGLWRGLRGRSFRAGVGSTGIRRIGLVVLTAGMLLLAVWGAGASALAFPETAGNPVAACLVLALSWAAVRRGAEVPGRCAAVLVRLLAALYGIVLVFSLPQLRWEWLRPEWSLPGAVRCFWVLLLPGAGLCLEREGRAGFPWQAWALVPLAGAGALVTAGILSPALAAEPMAFHTLARSVSVLGVMLRFEALISGAQLISGFCLCTLLLAAARSLLEGLLGKSRTESVFLILLPVLLALIWLRPDRLPELGGGIAICSALILTIPPLVGVKRKRKNI